MAETIYLITGIAILAIVIYDFFFTTLAQSGAAYVTKFTLKVAHRSLNVAVSVFGRKAYDLSGMIINLLVILVWIMLIWLGLFLLFSSDPGAIVNSSEKPADFYERLYFTGFTLSTLGVGDFTPTTSTFRIITACFSFFGFIFFTTAMTYLISVTSAVIQKRSLSSSIYFTGNNPREVIKTWRQMDRSQFIQHINELHQMLNTQSINLYAFPALYYYCTTERSNSLGINLTVLDEALSRALHTSEGDEIRKDVKLLRKTISNYLIHLTENFSHLFPSEPKLKIELPYIPDTEQGKVGGDLDMSTRRKILSGLLWSESFGWSDVYPSVEK